MDSEHYKKWKRVTNNKMRPYGEIDYKNKTISVNKKTHKTGNHPKWVKKNKNGDASLLDTIVHEEMHKDHPKMLEKTVRKKTSLKVKRMDKKSKSKFYKKYG